MDVPLPLLTFVLVAIPISVEDTRSLRIPNRLILVGALAVGVALLVPSALGVRALPADELLPAVLAGPLGGMLYAGGVLYTVRLATHGALGGGDIKLGVLLGAACGPTLAGAVLLAAALSALLYVMLLSARGSCPEGGEGPGGGGRGDGCGRARGRAVPFAPFLGASAAAAAAGALGFGGMW